jgi:hypothetical protein
MELKMLGQRLPALSKNQFLLPKVDCKVFLICSNSVAKPEKIRKAENIE